MVASLVQAGNEVLDSNMNDNRMSRSKDTTANPFDIHRVLINTSWIARLRWVAVIGQALTIAVARWGLGLPVPVMWLAAILAITVLTNVGFEAWIRTQWLSVPVPQMIRRGNTLLWSVMMLDLASLSALLYLTGGVTNPFCVFYLVNFAMAAVVLDEYRTWVAVAVGLISLALLTVWYQPLEALTYRDVVPLNQAGLAIGIGLCGVVVVVFIRRMNGALQRSESRLRFAEQVRARSERLEALGTLAAGAGHELTTPLSTIAVVSKELLRSLDDFEDLPASFRQDIQLVRDEVERCRFILNRMSHEGGRSIAEPLVEATVAQLIDEVVADLPAPARVIVTVQPSIQHRTLFVPLLSVVQSLRGLVQNALDATLEEKPVHLRAAIDGEELDIQVEDRGTGMTADVQARVFEPFFTTKEPGNGMGLGLFLAQNVIQRLGGQIELDSTPGQGTLVLVRLPLRP